MPATVPLPPNRVVFKAREGDAFRFSVDPAYPLALCERVDRRARAAGRADLRLEPVNLFAADPRDPADRDRITRLMAQALELDPTYEPRDLRRYVAIESNDPETVCDILRREQLEETEAVYVEGVTGATGEPDRFNLTDWSPIHLDYLGIDGLDVRGLWSRAVEPAYAVRFIDIEPNWDLRHPFLGGLIVGDSRDGSDQDAIHGTAVLSILLSVLGKLFAQPPGMLTWGPTVAGRTLSNIKSTPGPFNLNVVRNEDAIAEAGNALDAGDVLLLEIQKMPHGLTKWLPIETERATFDVIRTVTARQVIVVEPAGNGGVPLDSVYDTGGAITLMASGGDVANRPFVSPDRQSKALIVGAGDPRNGYRRQASSNSGRRVDCFAAGYGVVSTITRGDDPRGAYSTNGLKETSAAAALIAGALMLLQAYLRRAGTPPLGPDQLIGLVRDRTLATRQSADMGNMPSFAKLARAVRAA